MLDLKLLAFECFSALDLASNDLNAFEFLESLNDKDRDSHYIIRTYYLTPFDGLELLSLLLRLHLSIYIFKF